MVSQEKNSRFLMAKKYID